MTVVDGNVIAQMMTEAMDVTRASIWLLENEETELCCKDMYIYDQDAHQAGQVLVATDFPAYFAALKQGRAIDAHDARTDPRTHEFSKTYLEPNNITSMLDAAIRLHGQVVGVICMEHVSEPRTWQPSWYPPSI